MSGAYSTSIGLIDPGNYIMYHCHTDYSLLDSVTKPQEYVDLAVRDGMKALSFSEHGKISNWTEKWAACKEAGIKYMHSVEIYLTETLREKVRDNYHTVLIARNMDGLLELNKLVSRSFDSDHFYYTNRISFEEFLDISDNIITTSACLASPLCRLPEDHPMYMDLVDKYDFLEVQPHNHPRQIEFNKKLYELSQKTGKPLIAGTDTHSSTPYKAECRKVLLDAKHKSYGDEDSFDLSYKTYDELVEMFRVQGALPEDIYLKAIDTTNQLYYMTDEIDLDTSIKYPILHGTREADSKEFTATVERKFKEKLDAGIIPQEQKQAFEEAIEEEVRVFQKLQMDGFMLSMSELVSWCKEQGMALGPARGSVGGSRVAYVTDIIDLNPETWHTVFSRFCNEDRVEIGDIDIDCIESDRPAIFKYIIDRFGANKTARVAAFGTIQDKDAIDTIGRHLAQQWAAKHPDAPDKNPWSLDKIAEIKKKYDEDAEKTKRKYPGLFYYFDGMVGVKKSQSVHPAGMVISPITLDDNYGVFDKDGELCLFLDMDNVHVYTGLAKYDFLVLKTIQVIRDTCKYIGAPYPKSHEIDWNDQNVWEDMIKSPVGVFQFEGSFAFDSLKRFAPKNLFDMSLVAACIRPSGESYRDDLLAKKVHKNPSELIDDILSDSLGYLVYQEDTIRFLQQICGLSGSEADNVRRAIGRKQQDRLEKALPSILDGYCKKSPKPKDEAEEEAKAFLQVIEDSASYQFGYNHSIAYCEVGYLCAYYRYYHPLEFVTAYLNNAANQDDIKNGTELATKLGFKVTMPKWGLSRSEYVPDEDRKIIAQGLSSVKYMSDGLAEDLYEASQTKPTCFTDVLYALQDTSINTRQLDILIKLDFFSEFGNQRQLLQITDMFYNMFKQGKAKQLKKSAIADSPLDKIVQKYAVGVRKSGEYSERYTLLDIKSIIRESEQAILESDIRDLDDLTKMKNFKEAMGYVGYVSGKDEDRRKLYVMDVFPLNRKKDGKLFGYSVVTRSVGSGIESRFTVFCEVFNKCPVKQGDVILCKGWVREGQYFRMTSYDKIGRC